MAYNELIKNFERVRDYMREFYVFGFKSREQYDRKSARSYDDERRRLESWLGDYMGFRQTPDGKQVFLSIDSRSTRRNPLYKAWKAKSFTDGDITLHFLLFDILYAPEVQLSVAEIGKALDRYLTEFSCPKLFDESTLRKKLKEYVAEGLLLAEKQGKTLYYHRAEADAPDCLDALDFFSEVAPCGVVGSFLLDKTPAHKGLFAFKHHYIAHALDSDILCRLFCAMREKREVVISNLSRRASEPTQLRLVPLRIFISVQSGRQYLLAYQRATDRIKSFRLDYILSVAQGEPAADFDALRTVLQGMRSRMWGVNTQGLRGRTERVSFTICFQEDEAYIYQRLLREKRCGTVQLLDERHCRFTAEVFDANELLPWIRTFLCRITSLDFSNKEVECKFRRDLADMYRLYGIEGGVGE